MKVRFFAMLLLIVTSNLLFPQDMKLSGSNSISNTSNILGGGKPLKPESYRYLSTLAFAKSSLNPLGNSSMLNQPENLLTTNPTSLSNYKGLALGFSYGFEGETKDQNTTIPKAFSPISIGLVIPVNDFRIGFGYAKCYDLSYSNIDNKYESKMNSYFVASSFSISNVFHDGDLLSIGAKVKFLDLSIQSEVDAIINSTSSMIFKESGSNYGIGFGLTYKWNFDNHKFLMTGISYESKTNIETDLSIEPKPTTNLFNTTNVYWHPYLSNKITFSTIFQATSDLTFLADLISYYDDYEEYLYNFSTGMNYKIIESIIISFGLSTSKEIYASNLTTANVGLLFRLSGIEVGIAYANSGLSKEESLKQSIAKIHLGYSF